MRGEGAYRFDWLPAIVLAAGAVFSAWGLLHVGMDNEDVLRWLPDQSAARADFEYFRALFASDDCMVVAWPGCTVEDGRLAAFCARMREGRASGLIYDVTSGPDVLTGLGAVAGLEPEQLQRRLAGVFFGAADPQQTCAVVLLGSRGRADRSAAVRLVRDSADQTPGLGADQLLVAGYPWLAVAMSRRIGETFVRLLPLSAIGATLVALLCLRNLRLTLIGLVASGLAAGFSVALVPACGHRIGGLTMIVPTLAFVLTKSGTLHLTRYALERIGDWRGLLRVGWQPCTISTATTVLGVLTLLRSNYPAVREFGAFSAAALGFSLVVQLLVYPWLLVRWGQPGLWALAGRAGQNSAWRGLAGWVDRAGPGIVFLFALMLAVSTGGIARLRANVEAENLFRRDAWELAAIRRLEQQIGPMDQTELLLVFEEPGEGDFHRRLEYVRQLDATLERIRSVSAVHSLADYTPRRPRGGGLGGEVRRAVFRQSLEHHRGALAQGGLLRMDGNTEVWRISLRFPFSEQADFGKLEEAVRAVAGQFGERARAAWEGFQSPRIVYTGTTHLVHDSQQSLLGDFARNFLFALALITPVLVFVLRSLVLGLIAMLANVVPVAAVFGWMGWAGVPIDIALGMTASVALGIAVDDTTHLMIRFRDLGGSLGRIRPALSEALAVCGPAMLHTTLIACTGIGMFCLSELVVIARFAGAITALLTMALVADLFMLPASLAVCGRRAQRGLSGGPEGESAESAGAAAPAEDGS